MPKGIPIFYSKTLVNTEKMLESTDFACTLKETKTTIPISRTPKPISGFGLKPGRYRLSAVKVAGFDPLDANHAASTGGVASRPRQDVQTRKGKHWNERQPNDTARMGTLLQTVRGAHSPHYWNSRIHSRHIPERNRKTMKPGLRKVAALILASATLFGSGASVVSAAYADDTTMGTSTRIQAEPDVKTTTGGDETATKPDTGSGDEAGTGADEQSGTGAPAQSAPQADTGQAAPDVTTLPFTGGNAQIPTIWLWAGLAFLIIAAGAFSPMIRLRMGAGSKGRHAGTPTIGRHSR